MFTLPSLILFAYVLSSAAGLKTVNLIEAAKNGPHREATGGHVK